MKRKKPAVIFRILLAGLLLINIPVPAFAEETPETPDTFQTEEPAPESEIIEEESEQEPAETVIDEIPVISEEDTVITAEEAPAEEQEEIQIEEEADPAPETDSEEITAEEPETETEEEPAEDTEEEKTEEEINYPAVTLRETVEGVTVTLSAPEGSLPEGVTMTVHPVHNQAVFEAVDGVLAEEGKILTDAVAFDITLFDKEGNELQPNDFVKVSFSNTDLSAPAEGSEISVYRVSDDASEVTPVTTVAADDKNQLFITDHFTIYVSGGSTDDPNGDGTNKPNGQNHRYYLEYGETITLGSNESSWLHDIWYIQGVSHNGALTQEGESSKFTNTNEWEGYAVATICHEYGFNPFSYSVYSYEFYYVSLKPRESFNVQFNFSDVDQTDFTVEQEGVIERNTIITPPSHESSKYINDKLYIFSGWCSDEQCTKRIPSNAFYGIRQDIKAYAKYKEATDKYAIVFHGNADNCTSVPNPQYSNSNVFDNITKEYPERPGYLFAGWAATPDGKAEYSHYYYKKITIPEGRKVLDLYATWEEREAWLKYRVYDWENRKKWGKCEPTYEFLNAVSGISKGSTAIPAEGYKFVRWVDKNGSALSEQPQFIPEKTDGRYFDEVEYYAVFEPITFTVTFNTNGGTAIAAQTVNLGAKITKPADPTKDVCSSFVAWYTDEALTSESEFDFNTQITEDVTLYAKWNSSHTLTEYPAVAPDCTNDGNIAYWTCSKCNKYFADAEAATEIHSYDIGLGKLGHKPGERVIETIKAATCEKNGSHNETVKCDRCGNVLVSITGVTDPATGHDWGEWVPTENGKERTCLNAGCSQKQTEENHTEPHNIVKVPAVEALCEKSGIDEHYECTLCRDLYSDSAGTELVTMDSLRVSALGHETTKVTWPEYTVNATCTEDGHMIEIEKCERCGKILGTPEYTPLPALGHDWERTEYTAPTCTTEGHARGVCKRDNSHVEEVTLPALGHTETVLSVDVIKEATCTEDGKQIVNYGCARCKEELSHVEVTIPALEHSWSKWVTVKAATDSEPGLEVRVCQRDPSHRETREIPVTEEDSSEAEVKDSPAASILYYLGSGGGSIWHAASDQSLVFTFKRYYSDEETFRHFLAIDIDGAYVDPSNYTAAPGSVIITLNNTYLKSLSPGRHLITAYFDDGNSVTSEFYVGAKRTGLIPKTSDDSRIQMWTLIELCSLCVILITAVMLRKLDRSID